MPANIIGQRAILGPDGHVCGVLILDDSRTVYYCGNVIPLFRPGASLLPQCDLQPILAKELEGMK